MGTVDTEAGTVELFIPRGQSATISWDDRGCCKVVWSSGASIDFVGRHPEFGVKFRDGKPERILVPYDYEDEDWGYGSYPPYGS